MFHFLHYLVTYFVCSLFGAEQEAYVLLGAANDLLSLELTQMRAVRVNPNIKTETKSW